ncbi:MAG: InlB B-repeat-containing protein [Butyrivibrio sp.]|uniref:InlB B-repeat-containing protein n=1 Tax=Butyrivibrio sp. TaxID=28121 RepID=UPI0025BD2D58|nr:InlB B-repeat-containing protein [Butyrivibrio sp.]MBQ6589044.1 InlB B-repeat-containing protein [Butyrivibrio sp.]
MLKRSKKLLAVLLAVAFAITTFGSDFSFSNAKVFAADEEIANDVVSEDTIVTAEWEAVPEAEKEEEEYQEPNNEGASEETTDPGASNDGGEVLEDSASAESEVQEPAPEETKPAEETVATDETPVSGSTIIPEEDVAKESSAAANSASTSEDAASESSSDDAASLASSDVEAASDASSEASSDAASTASSAEKKSYPAQKFEGESVGILVEAQSEEGAFPAGTIMKVRAISDIEAVDTAKEALGEEVQQAKGVDISFYNAEGKEIEPLDSKSVRVSISLGSKLSGEEFSVIHQDDAGKTEKVAEANADGASFNANAFSVYIVAGSGGSGDDTTDKRAICTYNFYLRQSDYDNKTTPFSVQMVKEGDKLANPGVPDGLLSDEEFLGWYAVDGSTIPYGTVGHVTANSVVDVIAKIQTTYYLTYIGVDEEVYYVKKIVLVTGESTEVEVDDIKRPEPKKDTDTIIGWTLNKGSRVLIDKPVDVTTVKTVYAVATGIHWINFDGNGAGVTYTDPVYVCTDKSARDKYPAEPTRKGYVFKGWYTRKGAKVGEVDESSAFDWDRIYGDSDPDVVLYAKWVPNDKADYTIIIWKQSIDDDKNITDNDAKNYEYYASTTGEAHLGKKATVGSTVNESLFNKKTLLAQDGFHYGWMKGTRIENGVEVLENKIRCEEDTIINVYYDRDLMTINFKQIVDLPNGKGKIVDLNKEPYTGLYEQPLSKYGYVWPEGNWVFEDKKGLSSNYKFLNLDFVERFIFTNYQKTYSTKFTAYLHELTGTYTVYHYLCEGLDGKYEVVDHTAKHFGALGAEFEFYCDDYYRAFKPDHFTRGKDGAEEPMSVGTKILGNYTDDDSDDIYLFFHRLTAKIEFMDNFNGVTTKIPDDEVDDVFDEIKFEMPLYLDGTYNTLNFQKLAPDLSKDSKYDKPGYKFRGWSKDPTGQSGVYDWNEDMGLDNKVLYALYEPITCNVILDPNDGTIIKTSVQSKKDTYPVSMEGKNGKVVVAYGDELIKSDLMTSVTRPDYEFVGWYLDNQPYGYGEITNDITLVAHWRSPGNVKVIYIDNVDDPHWDPSGTGLPTDNYRYAIGSSAVVGAVPDKVEKGWSFIGWKVQKDSSNILRYPNSSIDIKKEYLQKNIPGYDSSYDYIVLEAQYDSRKGSSIDPEYTKITYHSNNGFDDTVVVDTGASGLLKVNETVLALSNDNDTKFTRTGYIFAGWSKVPGDNNPLFVMPGEKIAADNKEPLPNDLYAIWVTTPVTPPPPPYDPPPDNPPDNPPSTPPTPPTTPTPVAAGQVLGARRDTGNGAAVLGARRSRTEDTNNLALRILAIVAAGAMAAGLLMTSRKKDEEQKEE